MPRLPRITGEEALRALRGAGWQEVRRRGSHAILHHVSRSGRVTVPLHPGAVIKPKTLLSILDQAAISLDEFLDLLEWGSPCEPTRSLWTPTRRAASP